MRSSKPKVAWQKGKDPFPAYGELFRFREGKDLLFPVVGNT